MRRESTPTISTDELRAVLEGALRQARGSDRRIIALRRRVSSYASSSPIENIEVVTDRGRRVRLVFKDLSPVARLSEARRVRPAFLYGPSREIEVYQDLLDARRMGTPACYGAVCDPVAGRFWLFLERVAGRPLWQAGRLETWRDAARWLAAFHNPLDGRRRVAGLLKYDARYYRTWIRRAESFVCSRRGVSPDARRRFARLAARYDRAVRDLLALPVTVIHGEFYPSNVLVRSGRLRHRICPIDWEVAAIGPGAMDLAALMTGSWSPEQKRAMAEAYREAARRAGGAPPPMKDLAEWIERCQLHQAVQWLGWSPVWSPPDLHARNWLQEALRLGERILA
jgi:aminoglycoside phosphotransferase (APT) family kinase protein